jgi:hypothetical protein
LTAVDLPELERPTNATSCPVSAGKSAGLAALFKKVAVVTGSGDAFAAEGQDV